MYYGPCRFFLIPSTPCLDAISRRKEVKCEGKNLVAAENILVLRGLVATCCNILCCSLGC